MCDLTATIDQLISQGMNNMRISSDSDLVPSQTECMRKVYRKISQQANPIVSEPVIVHWIGGQPLIWFPVGCYKFESIGGCGPCDGYGKYKGYTTREGKKSELPRAIQTGLEILKKFGESQLHAGRERCAFNIGAADTLNDCAFSQEYRTQLYRGVAQLIQQFQAQGLYPCFLFETRLEQITEEKLHELRKIVPEHIPVSIGVGIEAADTFIREVLMNKAYGPDALQRLQEKVALAKQFTVDIEGHALLGTPGLTELEALASAIETTLAIHDAEAIDVILMTANIRKADSFATRLYSRELYTLPSIHATVETLRYCTEQREKVRILPFGFAAAVPILEYAHGCSECTDKIRTGLDTYATICITQGPEQATRYLREHYDTTFSCLCKNAWVHSLQQQAETQLQERIGAFVRTAQQVI